MTTIQHPYVAAVGALFIALCMTLAGAQADPAIQLLQPNGGERWQAGTVQQITWTSAGLDPGGRLLLYYKVTNEDWRELGETTPDQTSYPWTVPIPPAPSPSSSAIGSPGVPRLGRSTM